MNYEQLLEEAYKNVEVKTQCERFEVLKVKGHHEGSRTIISNFSSIASCLRRDQNHLIKFLSKELASSAELSGDRLILPRKVSSADINEKIKKYVNTFVLCSKCQKPDTELSLENTNVFLKCMACGNKQEIQRI